MTEVFTSEQLKRFREIEMGFSYPHVTWSKFLTRLIQSGKIKVQPYSGVEILYEYPIELRVKIHNTTPLASEEEK